MLVTQMDEKHSRIRMRVMDSPATNSLNQSRPSQGFRSTVMRKAHQKSPSAPVRLFMLGLLLFSMSLGSWDSIGPNQTGFDVDIVIELESSDEAPKLYQPVYVPEPGKQDGLIRL